MTAVKGRLLFVVNEAAFFVSHRLPLVGASREAGLDVHVAVAPGIGVASIASAGAAVHLLPLSRAGRNPWREGRTIAAMAQVYRHLMPQLVHHVSVKPVLYGTIAARAVGVPAVVNAITGLGWLFTGNGNAAKFRRRGAIAAYRFALRHPKMRVIVQNADDRDEIVRHRIAPENSVVLIEGSGVDLDAFPLRPLEGGVPIVLLPARMLRDKGVVEFVEAARLLRTEVNARFALVGGIDTHNPAGVSASTLNAWQAEGVVEWWGHRTDMPYVMSRAAIVVLPSYREGMPKVLLEAAASGRAIVTTDVPGCRAAVVPNENGLIVPPRDVPRLAAALRSLIDDPERRARMGAAGRRLAVRRWGIAGVLRATMDVYDSLIAL
jgi:glycosyltransferase involved in cell wall biosynthesis